MVNNSDAQPLVTCRARRVGPRCPFGNESIEFSLVPGGCVHLAGASGRGKTTLAWAVAGLHNPSMFRRLQNSLDVEIDCDWDESLPPSERCGVLLQTTTLVDELSVASNLALALQNGSMALKEELTSSDRDNKIAHLLSTVGLTVGDGEKRPHQLSGGMARRASLALALAQRKHVIVLDEPFTGLDMASASSVVQALLRLRVEHGTAFLLISHQEPWVKRLMDPTLTHNNVTALLEGPSLSRVSDNADQNGSTATLTPTTGASAQHNWKVHGVSWRDRFVERFWDYFGYSIPLIVLAFGAAGMALAMLTADVLHRLDVTDPVLRLVDKEVRPMIRMITGEDPGTFTMLGVRMKVKVMLNATIPNAKATLYALGMTRLLVLELGPLLTALLLCGRIGGSYAGRVATLGATRQDALLQTLGISAVSWTLGPSLAASALAAPALTVLGTGVALVCAAWMGHAYNLISIHEFWNKAWEACFPQLRLRCSVSAMDLWTNWTRLPEETALSNCVAEPSSEYSTGEDFFSACVAPSEPTFLTWSDLDLDCRPTFSDSVVDAFVEVLTHPTIYHLFKAFVLSLGIVFVADKCARRPLTPRLVPLVITAAVVLDGLWVLLADWGFSQLWLRRHPSETEWNIPTQS